jgi:hypothetical protein
MSHYIGHVGWTDGGTDSGDARMLQMQAYLDGLMWARQSKKDS